MANLLALLLGFGLMQMGNTFQGTLLSVRGDLEGFSSIEIGAVGSAFWAGIVVGSLCTGRLIRRVGHIRTFAALGAIASTAPLLHLLNIHPAAWIAARALTGFCFAGLFVVVESWLNGAATSQTRGQIMGVYSMTGLIAGIGGQLLLPAADPSGFQPFCVIAAIIALALVPIALTSAASPASVENGPRSSLKDLYRQSPFGTVSALLCGASAAVFFALGPIFAQRRGLNTGQIAAFMTSATLGGFLTAWPLGWLSDRMDRRLVVIGAAITTASSMLAMSAFVPVDASPWLLYICAAPLGASIIPVYSIVLAHVNDGVAKGEFVAASSSLLLVQAVGATIGPLIGGVAMDAWRYGLSSVLITAQVLIVVWGLYRLAARPTRSAPKGPFVVEPPVPVSTTFAQAHTRGGQ